MGIYRLTQRMEIKFWNALIPVIEEEGSLMKTMHSIKDVSRSKAFNIILLIVIWAAIGFVFGMIIGRVLWIIQFL